MTQFIHPARHNTNSQTFPIQQLSFICCLGFVDSVKMYVFEKLLSHHNVCCTFESITCWIFQQFFIIFILRRLLNHNILSISHLKGFKTLLSRFSIRIYEQCVYVTLKNVGVVIPTFSFEMEEVLFFFWGFDWTSYVETIIFLGISWKLLVSLWIIFKSDLMLVEMMIILIFLLLVLSLNQPHW